MEQSQEKMTDVIDEGAAADSVSVRIILVPKDEAAHEKKKLKRTPQSDSKALEIDRDKLVIMESSTLRKCSRYFATCMSGRWETDTVFHLELQTEAGYYHDCFARMRSPFLKPIPTITHGIQLFKVASQIEYYTLMDICERYLASMPWSTDEEAELRSLCAMGDLPSNSDLVVRLRFPLTKKARQAETQSLIQRTLSRYLKNALALNWDDVDNFGIDECPQGLDFRVLFAEAFRTVCEESNSEMGHDAAVHVLDAMKTELVNILLSLESSESRLNEIGLNKQAKKKVYDDMGDGTIRFVWMFQLLREANAAHVVVELLMKHDVSKILRSSVIYSEVVTFGGAAHEWTKMMYYIFQDILGGRLFLKSSERTTLFLNWSWVLQRIEHLAPGEPPVSELVTSFLMSFPQLVQEEIFLKWGSDWRRNEAPGLSDAHGRPVNHIANAMWLKSMLCTVTEVPNLVKDLNVTSQSGCHAPSALQVFPFLEY